MVRLPRMHPHMLRHAFVTTMLDAGVDLRDVQIAARHTDCAPRCITTALARTWTGTRTTSSPPTWPLAPELPTNTLSCRVEGVGRCVVPGCGSRRCHGDFIGRR